MKRVLAAVALVVSTMLVQAADMKGMEVSGSQGVHSAIGVVKKVDQASGTVTLIISRRKA